MSDEFRELYEQLRRPFEPHELEWRISRSGTNDKGIWAIVVPYVQRPSIINRLNDVCGITGWTSDVRIVSPSVLPAHQKVGPVPIGHVAVGVGIRAGDTWVWRWDGTGMLEPDLPYFSASDAGKGDVSNAFKRATEQLGVGVYLRELKGPFFAILNENGRYNGKIEGQYRRWDPPGITRKPQWPGELVDRSVPSVDELSQEQPAPDPGVRVAQEAIAAEERGKEIRRLKVEVGEFMTRAGFYPYHLEALILTHPELKLRFAHVTGLKQQGSAEDWTIVWEATKRNLTRWEEAPRELAEEFPTSEERVSLLHGLIERKKPSAREVITINATVKIGWSDGVEFWINELENRDNP